MDKGGQTIRSKISLSSINGKRIPHFLIIVCILSLLVRIFVILHLKTYNNYYNDTDIGQIPYNLIHGLGYTYDGKPSAHFVPGYVSLWAALMFVFGIINGQLVLQLLQAIALSVIPILWYRFSKFFFDKDIVSLIASVWLSIYPELLLLSATMYAESIMLFLLLLSLVMLMRWRESTTNLKGILFGVITAVLILTNARMGLFIGIPLLYFLFRDWKERKGVIIRQYLIPIVCIISLMGIWVTRNIIELNAPLLNSTLGNNLWAGHNINATGTSKYRIGNVGIIKINNEPGKTFDFPKSAELELALKKAKSETEAYRAYQQEAFSFIINNPEKEIELCLKKFYYAWWRDPTSVFTYLPIYIVPWSITLFFFIIGLVISFFQSKKYLLFYLIFIGSTLLQIIVFAGVRYKIPIYPFVFGIATIGFVYIIELLISKNINWQKKYNDFTSYLLR